MPRKFDFWSRVDKSGDCWIWTGAVDQGYGCTYPNNKKKYAHRWVWEQEHGETDVAIFQTCGNKLCVHPDHLAEQTLEYRFWEKVDKRGDDECWIWKGSKDVNGYGRISIHDTPELSHRVSYIIKYGDIPGNLHLLHKCDNPSCVNPNHLNPGTQADNIKDMMEKGRSKVVGEDNHSAVLNNKIVVEIKKMAAKGMTAAQINKEFPNLFRETIRHVVVGNTWKHVSIEEEMAA